MNSTPINTSAHFYGTAVGKVNAQIIGNSCTAINREMLEKYGRYDSAIFLGIGDGLLLEQIGGKFTDLTVIEGSNVLVEQARTRFGAMRGLKLVASYFENFQLDSDQRVSCILGNHVLEHLTDPVAVLRQTRTWLKRDGIAIFTVPSASSLHRRIGVQLGMLKHTAALSEQDVVVGHQRVYDAAGLKADVLAAGYEILESGGFNLKLVSQSQMLNWPESLHDAIYRVSRDCPADLCSNLYVTCRTG